MFYFYKFMQYYKKNILLKKKREKERVGVYILFILLIMTLLNRKKLHISSTYYNISNFNFKISNLKSNPLVFVDNSFGN